MVGALVAGLYHDTLGLSLITGIVQGYVLGAILGALIMVGYLLDSKERKKRFNEFLREYEESSREEIEQGTKDHRRHALLLIPLGIGPVYVVFRALKLTTNWMWSGGLTFAALGAWLGTLVDRPIGFGAIGLVLGCVIAYRRRHPGIPDFAREHKVPEGN